MTDIGAIEEAIRRSLVEAGLDPTPPYDLFMLEEALGIRVRFSPYLRRHQMVVVGEFQPPAVWDDLDAPARLQAALMAGAILFVHDPIHAPGAC